MKFYNIENGRFGNAMFRYIASIMFTFFYDCSITYDNRINNEINDTSYLGWMKMIESGIIPELDKHTTYKLSGFYQHENLIKKYKKRIIDYIKINQNDKVCVNNENYYSKNIIYHDVIKKYNIVVHLRLDDFTKINMLIQPNCIKNVLDNLIIKYNPENFVFVLDKPKTEFEKRYINYFTTRYNIIIESNDVLTDYHILKNAKILVSSTSTLCWIAALLSETIEELYFPNYKHLKPHINYFHETIDKPIENTIKYNIEYCSEIECIF
jgi:hypothetical protein